MRRLFVLMALIGTMALPTAVAARTTDCTVTVDPGRGRPRDVFRISGHDFPRESNGGSLEVEIAVMRVIWNDGPHLKLQTLLSLFLIPDVRDFFVDYNLADLGSTATRLPRGHYVVVARTPHQRGCRTSTGFDVVRGRSLAG